MGTYHQGGIIPTQVYLSQVPDATQAIWWKTYSPPIWLLNGKNEVLKTHDVMGMAGEAMIRELERLATCHVFQDKLSEQTEGTYLIAPMSATFLDRYLLNDTAVGLRFAETWKFRQHLNLDDLDFGDDGIWETLRRIVGRRGLAVWRVTKDCSAG